MRESIFKILNEYEEIWHNRYIIDNEYPIINYDGLVEHLITHELHLALTELIKHASNPDINFKESFKNLAHERYEKNKNTAISYTAATEAPSNKLYDNLYLELYKNEDNLFSRLSILCPQVKNVLQINCSSKIVSYAGIKRVVPTVEASLEDIPVLKNTHASFSEIIIDGDIVLPVHSIVNKSYPHLRSIYLLLHQQYPTLYEKVKSHNSQIYELCGLIEFINNYGITPHCAIEDLRKQLLLGGERITGKKLAALSTTKAIYHFHRYLELLPNDLKRQILNLTDGGMDSLDKIIHDLSNNVMQCVESAAARLKKITERLENKKILMALPDIQQQSLKIIKEIKELARETLDIIGHEQSHELPQYLLPKVIHKIKIKDPVEFGEFLSNFTAHHYSPLLEHLSVPIKNTKDLIECCVFLAVDQKSELIKSLLPKAPSGMRLKLSIEFGKFLSNFESEIYPVILQYMKAIPITGFNSLMDSLKNLPSSTKYHFFEALRDSRKDYLNYIKTPRHLGEFLSHYDGGHYKKMIAYFKPFPITCYLHVKMCLDFIENEQKIFFLKAILDHLKIFIKDPRVFGQFSSYLFEHQLQEFFSEIGDQICVNTLDELEAYLFCLSKNEKILFISRFKNLIKPIINSEEHVLQLLTMCNIPINQHRNIITKYLYEEWLNFYSTQPTIVGSVRKSEPQKNTDTLIHDSKHQSLMNVNSIYKSAQKSGLRNYPEYLSSKTQPENSGSGIPFTPG